VKLVLAIDVVVGSAHPTAETLSTRQSS